MNKSHRLWNAALSSWVAVPESAGTHVGGTSRTRVTHCAFGITPLAMALAALAVPSQAQNVIDGGTVVTVPGTFASPWNAGTNPAVGTTSQGGTLAT